MDNNNLSMMNDQNLNTSALSTASLNRSTSYQSPMLNEIFEYKLSLKNKTRAFYSSFISITVCLLAIVLISTDQETFNEWFLYAFDYEIREFYLKCLLNGLKTVLFLILLIFICNLLFACWSLITNSMKKLSLGLLNTNLSEQQKKLLGVDALGKANDGLEQDARADEQLRCLKKQQQQELQSPVRKSTLPYFALISPSTKTPTKTTDSMLMATSPMTASPTVFSVLNNSLAANNHPYVHHHRSLNDTENTEAINLNEKYINRYFSKLEEKEKFEQQKHLLMNSNSYNYNYENANYNPDDAFERYNYQQKQKNFMDNSLELRNYQYQIGTKPVNLTPTTSSSATATVQSPQISVTTPTRLNSIEHFSKLTHSPVSNTSAAFKSPVVKMDNFFFLGETEVHVSESDSEYLSKLANEELRRALQNTNMDSVQLEQVWCKKFNLNRTKLDIERENLRKWISLTILKPIIKEINIINERLVNLGNSEMKIGQASVAQLNNFSQGNKLISTLPVLIPYLESSTRQEYLVKRLNELATSGCISEYHWNNGGSFKNKEWVDYLPTDASLLMHFFCTYMDSRLLPRYPNLKPFTSQFFFKESSQNKRSDLADVTSPSNSNSLIKHEKIEPQQYQSSGQLSNSLSQQQLQSQQQAHVKHEAHNLKLYIHECKSDPPCYRVIFNKDVYEINNGRNNLFDAILCFLHITKGELNGRLGAICLGSSGVNLLSVIE